QRCWNDHGGSRHPDADKSALARSVARLGAQTSHPRISSVTLHPIRSDNLRTRIALTLWLDLYVNLARRGRKIFQESGAEPALHLELVAVIPVAPGFSPAPLKFPVRSGKRRRTKDRAKSFLGIGDIGNRFVDHRVDAGDERLA